MRRISLWLLAAVALVLPLAGAPSVGAAPAQEDEDITIDVTAGVDGHISSSRSYPIVVDVTSPRLLAGTLAITIETDFGPSQVLQAIEVAATTTKRFVVTAPPGSSFGGNIQVRISSGGRSVADESTTLSIDPSEELVGVLPGLLPALDRSVVPLAIDVGVARLAELTTDVLAEGPLALEVYDQIASGPGDLDDLAAADASAIATWVAQGGVLLVDATPGLPVALPEGLDPSPGSSRTVGLGRVVLTGGVLVAGQWQGALFPTPTQSINEEGMLNSGMSIMGDVTSSLSRDAGFRLPGLSTLLLVLAGYIVVVGPLAWFVTRRAGRTTMIWVVIPVVAALVTGTLQIAGDDFKGSDKAVHVTMVESGPSGDLATTSVFVASRGRGGTSVGLEHGWQVATNPFFGSFDGRTTPLRRSGDGATVAVDPGSGGASVVRVRGPVDLAGGLEVTATSDADGTVKGTVENTLDVDLAEVAVFISRTAVAEVGSLGAGESKEWTLDDATDFDFDAQPESSVWAMDVDPEMFGFQGPVQIGKDGEPIFPELTGADETPDSSLSALGDLTAMRGSNFKPPGEVVAIGWTRALDAPIRVGGEAVRDGRTGIVARSSIAPAADRMTDTVPVRFLLRGPDAAGMFPQPLPAGGGPGGVVVAPQNSGSALFGFVVPDRVGERPVDQGRLRFHLPSLFIGAEVWTPGGWQTLPVTGVAGRGGEEIDLPDGAVVNGVVYARMLIPFDQVPPKGREFLLYEAAT